MRKLTTLVGLVALLLAVGPLAWVGAPEAAAAGVTYGNYGTFFTASNATGATDPVDSSGSSYVAVHIFRADAATASTSSVYLQISQDGTKWYRAATFTNVTGMDATYGDGGDSVSVPSWPYMRLYVVSCSSGTLTAKWFKR